MSLIAEFTSSFGIRIMCLDASLEEEVTFFYDLFIYLCFFSLILFEGDFPHLCHFLFLLISFEIFSCDWY